MDVDVRLGNELFNIIEDNLHLSREIILSKTRIKKIVDAKKIIIVLLKYNSNYGPMAVGRFLNLEHGTIIRHVNKHSGLMISDKEYRKKYKSVELLVNDLFVKFNSLSWKLDSLLIERDLINKEIKYIRKRLSL